MKIRLITRLLLPGFMKKLPRKKNTGEFVLAI